MGRERREEEEEERKRERRKKRRGRERERDILFSGVITCIESMFSPLFLQIALIMGHKEKEIEIKVERSLIKRSSLYSKWCFLQDWNILGKLIRVERKQLKIEQIHEAPLSPRVNSQDC